MKDTIIIGGGAAGLSCALVLGSGLKKPFAEGKNVAIIMHQKASHLQTALFNNVVCKCEALCCYYYASKSFAFTNCII